MKFKPDKITVHKGDTVLFINQDLVRHDVTEEPEKCWRSPALATGESWRLVVTQNTDYLCSFHPTMKGKIVIR